MAKRKLNVKFLAILGFVFVLALGGAYAAYRYAKRLTPEQVLVAAQDLEKAGDYEKAGQFFAAYAGQMLPGDPSAWLQAGDAMLRFASVNPEFYGRARSFYRRALELDPRHHEALKRVVKMYREEAEQGLSAPTMLEELTEYAQRLSEVDPTDVEARVAAELGVQLGYLLSTELESEAADQSIARLEKIIEEHPELPDPPLFVARAKLVKASRMQSINPEAAIELRNSAVSEFEERIAKTGESTRALLARWQVKALGMGLLRDNEARRAADEEAYQVMRKAAENAKPEDGPSFVQALLQCGRMAERRREHDFARQCFERIQAARPWDPTPRRELGEMLSRQGKSDEALEVMRSQPPQSTPVPGLEGVQLQNMLASLELSMLRIRLDRMQSLPEDQKAAEVDQIDQALKAATEKFELRPDSVDLLRLRGTIELARGQTAAALNTLNRAYGQAVAQNANAEQRLQLMMLLANANLRLNQTGQAKDLLEGVTREASEHLPARELLASLYLMENNAAAAKPHVEFLLQRNPDEVRYQRLAMQLGVIDRPALEARYAQMPETTRDERLAKLRLAAAGRKLDEIIRITRAMLAADKKDREATLLLASALFESNKRDESLQVLRAGLEADPNMADAANLLARLEAEIAGTVADYELEEAKKIPDPFQRNMRLFELSVARGKIDESLQYLKEAEKNDRNHRAAELLFSHYGSTRDWANAQIYLDKLAAANADQAGGRLFRARMMAARGEVRQAIELARQVTTSLPDLANGWLTLAQCQQLAGMHDEAAADYVRAIDRAPTNTDALRGVIESLYAANRFEESKQYIEMGRRLQPENTFFRQIELAWELSHGDPARIVDSRKLIVTDRPEVPENWLSLGVAYAGAIRKSQVDGKTADADRYLRLAIETFRDAMQRFPEDARFVTYFADLSRQGKNLNAGVQAIQAFGRLPSQQGKPDSVLMLADLYARAEQPVQAIPAMRQFLVDNPGVHPAVRIRLAKLLVGSRQVDEAVAVLEAGATDDDVRREQIEMLINVNRFDEARQLIANALKQGETTLLFNLSALIELRSNNPQAASAMLDKSFAIDPNDPAALYYRALIRASSADGDLAGAIADLTKVRDRLPNNLEARLLLGEILYRRGDTPQAIQEFEAIRERYPAERRAVLRLAELYINAVPPRWQQAERVVRETRELPGLIDDPELLNAEAIVLLNQGKVRAAEPLINQAAQKSPNSMAITQTQIDVLLALDRHDQVLQAVDNALKRAPNLFWLYSARGRAEVALRRSAEATASFTRAIELAIESGGNQLAQPVVLQMAERLGADVAAKALGDRMSDPGWKIILAPLFDVQGQRDRAVQLADELIAARESMRRVQLEAALRTAAQTYHNARDYEKAYKAYKDLLELRPDDFGALNNIAFLLVTEGAPGGGPPEALTHIKKAYDIVRAAGGSNPMIADTYGWVLILNGQLDAGIAVLEKVIEEAEIPDAFFHLGSGYFRKEMYPQAVAVLQRGKEVLARSGQQSPEALDLAGRFDDLLSRARVMGGGGAAPAGGNN